MAKGIFTQGVCLLTNGQVALKDMKSALQEHGFEIVKQTQAQENWCFGGESLLVAYRPDVNGYAAVDVVNKPWPDGMGDPKADPMLMGAWSMGHFGPYTYPGGLERAGQHSWSWEPGRTVAQKHRGFIRIRLSYAFGASDNTPLQPQDLDPISELQFLSRLSLALLDLPGIVSYFNPNGEVLRDSEGFREMWRECQQEEKLPLSLWMNIRFFNLNEKFGFMDTVGNGQLDVSDIEAIFPLKRYEPGEVDYYLRNVTHYLLDSRCHCKAAIQSTDLARAILRGSRKWWRMVL